MCNTQRHDLDVTEGGLTHKRDTSITKLIFISLAIMYCNVFKIRRPIDMSQYFAQSLPVWGYVGLRVLT